MLSIRKLCFALFIIALILCLTAVSFADGPVRRIILDSGSASLDGEAVPEYDHVWHADPSAVHDEVKNAPAEYFTGTKPSGEDTVHIAHDIYYFPEVPAEAAAHCSAWPCRWTSGNRSARMSSKTACLR